MQVHAPAANIPADAPCIGLVLQKSHINTKDECHYVAMVAELEARGAKVITLYRSVIAYSECTTAVFSTMEFGVDTSRQKQN